MSRRSENIAFKVMPNGNIRAYQADKPDKSGVSELQFTNPENVSPTVIVGNTIKVIETKSMYMKELKKITFHNADEGEVAKCILAGRYKFGAATLLRQNGSTMTSVIETNMADPNAIELPSELKGKKFRIRKLTPKECFRLMGVNDADIDKMQAAGISNSGLYKLAGNSIVAGGNYTDSNGNVDGVLFNLFRKMFIDTQKPDSSEGMQLKLF